MNKTRTFGTEVVQMNQIQLFRIDFVYKSQEVSLLAKLGDNFYFGKRLKPRFMDFSY